jgi:hypothetical protein
MSKNTGSKRLLQTPAEQKASAEGIRKKPAGGGGPTLSNPTFSSVGLPPPADKGDGKKSVEGDGPTFAADEIMVSARDVAKLLREADERVFDARMLVKCVLNHGDRLMINFLSSVDISPSARQGYTEDLLDFQGASKGVLDLLAALERDLCEASTHAKTGGIGFLKPYFNRGVLRADCDEIYAKHGAPQVRACGAMG